MNMLRERRATDVLGLIWGVEVDGGIHFQICPEERTRLGQIKSNLKIHNYSSKHAFLVPLSVQIPKTFFRTTKEMPKKDTKNVT